MGCIAKGSITLETVNDAYTVSLTKPSCVIHADFDGSNPKLNEANTVITVSLGTTAITFDCTVTSTLSTCELTPNDTKTSYALAITAIPTDSLDGTIVLQITTGDGYSTEVRFTYAVVRESTMLDWIQDWEGGKTKIGGTYIMTPKLFIGKKSDYATYAEDGTDPKDSITSVPNLTGVYIGPDEASTGIYGYKDSVEIFHLNGQGGMVGGWGINDGGIISKDGYLSILSEGTVKAVNSYGDIIWALNSDGTAKFASGAVWFDAEGNASFEGRIVSTEGTIGGWDISHNLRGGNICLDAVENCLGITWYTDWEETEDYSLIPNVQQYGGVAIYCTSDSQWGLMGYSVGTDESAGSLVFSLGSANMIAGWSFDNTAMWSGTKNNTVGAYTAEGITIGTNGMRGQHWYIDNNGDISFMDGKLQFSSSDNGGNIVGWMLNDKRFSTNNIAVVADATNAGIYMSVSDGVDFNSLASSSLTDYIDKNGGIYIKTKTDGVSLGAYDTDGYNIFKLRSNGTSSIADWNIEHDAIYVGTKTTSVGTFTSEGGSITLGEGGIRGYKWRFEADGSGALAGENITWDKDGNMTINATLSADKITSGTISTANIQNASKTWFLNQDGSGQLANGNITWNADGAFTASGGTFQSVTVTGTWRSEFAQYVSGGAFVFFDSYDNLNIPYAGVKVYMNTEDKINIGRTVHVTNYLPSFSRMPADSCIVGLLGDNEYFYENGTRSKTLQISRQCVTLLGCSSNGNFAGWLVISRTKIFTESQYGASMPCLAMGKVTYNASDKSVLCSAYTFDNSEITVTRTDIGKYHIEFSSSWFQSADEVFVQATGVSEVYDTNKNAKVTGAMCKATVAGVAQTGVDIYTSDDDVLNDGDFNFTIHNYMNWN